MLAYKQELKHNPDLTFRFFEFLFQNSDTLACVSIYIYIIFLFWNIEKQDDQMVAAHPI